MTPKLEIPDSAAVLAADRWHGGSGMNQSYQAGLRVSEYVLEERLGSGAFGEVWRARHHVWDKDHVAVKLPLQPEYVRYLQREGLVAHGLHHPNIVGVRGLDPYADTPYLVMDLVRGPSLHDVLAQHPKGLPIPVVQAVLVGVLQGLAAAHAGNVLHRDLKPGNVLLDLNGRPLGDLRVEDVKLSDFGLGAAGPDVLRSIAQSTSLDRDSSRIVGTLAYMAPELRDGKTPADARTDLFAIGVMLFEMLTGERPAGAELPGTLRADTPAALDNIFRQLYSRHERRYASADAVLADLTSHGPPPPPVPVSAALGATQGTQFGGPPPVPAATVAGQCSACHRPYEAGDQFCTHCGNQLVSKIRRCTTCGAYPGAQDQFCIFCGSGVA